MKNAILALAIICILPMQARAGNIYDSMPWFEGTAGDLIKNWIIYGSEKYKGQVVDLRGTIINIYKDDETDKTVVALNEGTLYSAFCFLNEMQHEYLFNQLQIGFRARIKGIASHTAPADTYNIIVINAVLLDVYW